MDNQHIDFSDKNFYALISTLLDYLKVNFFAIDINGNYINKNQTLTSIVGNTKVAKSISEAAWISCQEVIRSQKRQIIEEEYHGKYYLSIKVPIIQNDICEGVTGISFDITAQKEAEAREKAALADTILAKKQIEFMEKQVALFKQLSGTVAHELNTPLRGIQLGSETIQEFLPMLLEAHKVAKKAELIKNNVTEKDLESLETVLNNMVKEIDASFLFIDMLLSNIRDEKFKGEEAEDCSMKDLVEEALERYPLNYKQKERISIDMSYNFVFRGSRKLLIHVLFNLLKNALYYVAKASKGEITIWCEEKEKFNELHFKDTGTGISEEVLPHIFDQFYSKTLFGTGIGLTYCKMVMDSFNGSITCKSTEGEYTEFILSFPKV